MLGSMRQMLSLAASTGPKVTLKYTLNNPNPYGTSDNDNFGFSVGISDTYAIVGAYLEENTSGTSASGRAYVYNLSTGNLVYTLNNPNAYGAATSDYFGIGVAVSDTYAIVGAYGEDDAGGTDSGKAYVFDLSTGNLVYTLNNPNAYGTSGGDQFGQTVAITNSYAIVSTYTESDDAGNAQSGIVYVYDLSTGNLSYTIDNPNAYNTKFGDRFGYSVDATDTYIIAGAPNEDEVDGSASGKAYVFDITDGSLIYTFNNPNAYDTPANDYFGNSVAITDTHAVVGAYFEDDAGGTGSGKAYVFDLATGNLLWTLDNPNAYDTSVSDIFGNDVAITDNLVIVAASQEDDSGGTQSGKVYVFDLTTGNLLHTLDNPNAYGTSDGDRFGIAVAATNTHMISGAYTEDDANGVSSGKAYIYQIS